MTSRMINIAQPSTGIEEWEATKEAFEKGWLTQGQKVAEFEKKFAERHESKFGLATTSCTTGLHLILLGLGIGAGDEVLVPAFTWVSTANVVLQCGAKPVFVDVEENTFNLDPHKIKEHLTENTKAIILVHLFGLCADVDSIKKELPKNVHVIEDAACGAGATYKHKSAGSLGTAAAFSFHPRKIITTGEGGMVTTNDPELASRMECIRNHGASISEEQRHSGPQPYLLPEFNVLGFNYRMTDIQGSVGLVQLGKLDSLVDERIFWADYYREQLQKINWLSVPKDIVAGTKHSYQSFVLLIDPDESPATRNYLMGKLQDMGIATRPGTHAVHMLKFYKEMFEIDADDFPVAKKCDLSSIAIPLHNKMKPEDYKYVVSSIRGL